MLDLTEITARAQDAPRQTVDAEVVFDVGITHELDTLRTEQAEIISRLADIDETLTAELTQLDSDTRAADPRPTEAKQRAAAEREPLNGRLEQLAAEIEDAQTRASEFLVTFRFTALHGFEWRELTSRSSPRADVPDDINHGYNVDEIVKIVAARTGVRVGPDGEVIPVTGEQWDGVWATAPSLGLLEIRSKVLYLNQYAGFAAKNEAVVAARKALTARQDETPASRSASGSTPDVSPAGNRSRSRTTSGKTAA